MSIQFLTAFLIVGQHLARSTRGRPCAPPVAALSTPSALHG
ncbi:hypothetical protein [Hylemonella gracilis]|nr:hypothetical protein [Hylemonella gracilis]